jgi:hypothetical protein
VDVSLARDNMVELRQRACNGRRGCTLPRTVLTPDKRLGLVLVVNAVMVLALVGVGLAANSLGVLASGADYLGDVLGTGLSLVALRMSRRPAGHPRATSFAALVNATLLLLVTLAVSVEAVYRLSTGAPSIDGLPVVLVSVVAAAAMIACALILGDVQGDLNMQSVMLDTVADAGGSLGCRGQRRGNPDNRRTLLARFGRCPHHRPSSRLPRGETDSERARRSPREAECLVVPANLHSRGGGARPEPFVVYWLPSCAFARKH